MKLILTLAAVLALARHLPAQAGTPSKLQVAAGKSIVIEVPEGVARVAVGSGDVVDAVAVSQTEVLLNGKAPGETSMLLWRKNNTRQQYDLLVTPSVGRLERVRGQLLRELGQALELDVEDGTVFLRGTVDDVGQAQRAMAIAANLGKTVNLLRVAVPAAPAQILLKIRFADVDRNASTELGANFFSTGAANTPGSISTQQFPSPAVKAIQGNNTSFTISDALNLFLFRPDLNLGATIKALQSKNLVQILAEPNLLASAGKEASFLAGGEFPYPVVQAGGAGLNTVTILFRPFGIRINFIATITPRGSIHLQVAPEVSSLDYANGLMYQGFTVPGLSVRKMQTEIELENQQSFAIAGLLDNRATESLSKVPGLGNIPLFGKLFQSRAISRNKSELLVVVTPELVQPIPAGGAAPSLDMPVKFMKGGGSVAPGGDPVSPAVLPARASVPYETLVEPKGTQASETPLSAAPSTFGGKK